MVSNFQLRDKQVALNAAVVKAKGENRRAQALVSELALDRGLTLSDANQASSALVWVAGAAHAAGRQPSTRTVDPLESGRAGLDPTDAEASVAA